MKTRIFLFLLAFLPYFIAAQSKHISFSPENLNLDFGRVPSENSPQTTTTIVLQNTGSEPLRLTLQLGNINKAFFFRREGNSEKLTFLEITLQPNEKQAFIVSPDYSQKGLFQNSLVILHDARNWASTIIYDLKAMLGSTVSPPRLNPDCFNVVGLSYFAGSYNNPHQYYTIFDFNNDGRIDLVDFVAFTKRFNPETCVTDDQNKH